MPRGGRQPGAGRPRGSTGARILNNQDTTQRMIALWARDNHRRQMRAFAAAKRAGKIPDGMEPPTKPPSDPADAARWALIDKGMRLDDARTIVELWHQAFGRAPYQMQHGGDEDQIPIPVAVQGPTVYRCEVPRRPPRASPTDAPA